MELVKLTSAEFKKMTKLVQERTGIYIPESKKTMLSNRLRRRMRALNLDTFRAYYDLLCDPGRCEEELPHFLSAITTNETYFFRNESLWKFICETWIPGIVEAKREGHKRVRIWSAASSSGEEAYTTAICLREQLPNVASWNVSIIGTDISSLVLDRAAAAEYKRYAVARMPKALLKKWFIQNDETYSLKPAVKELVRFQFHNLRDPFPNGKFDLVFLRNVLMYFDNDMKRRVIKNVVQSVMPEGYMIVGDVDPIRNNCKLAEVVDMEYCGPNVYRKVAKAKATPALAHTGRSANHE